MEFEGPLVISPLLSACEKRARLVAGFFQREALMKRIDTDRCRVHAPDVGAVGSSVRRWRSRHRAGEQRVAVAPDGFRRLLR